MKLTIDFIDVGQGDCTVINHPDGSFSLIDVGPRASPIVDWLEEPAQLQRQCRSIVLTHNDSDHAGALTSILTGNRQNFGRVYMLNDRDPADPIFSTLFRKLLELRAANRLQVVRLEAAPDLGPIWKEGAAELRVMFPTFVDNTSAKTPNHTSGIIALFIGESPEVVWSGDAALASLYTALAGKKPRWTVGPHHGAPIDFAKSRHLIPDIVSRRSYLSLQGGNNRYGHPNKHYVTDLSQRNCRVICSEITRACHPDAAQPKFKVMDGNSLLGYPPMQNGNPCRGGVRIALRTDQMVVDRWDLSHLERVEKLRRPMCLASQN